MQIKILYDNILNTYAEAIVNSANNNLVAGSGLCGAIFEKAGNQKTQLQKECNEIGYCATGHAVMTKAYNLHSKYIIHAVGPRYNLDDKPSQLLQSTYLSSLQLADDIGLRSIAFPCISTGIYGFPIEEATEIALTTIFYYKPRCLKFCYLYCYTNEEYQIYLKTLKRMMTRHLKK